MAQKVTERDFRLPEFRDAVPEDYEFRADGKIVRKDRWETGIHSIRGALGLRTRDGFEIKEVIQAVKALMDLLPDREIPEDEGDQS